MQQRSKCESLNYKTLKTKQGKSSDLTNLRHDTKSMSMHAYKLSLIIVKIEGILSIVFSLIWKDKILFCLVQGLIFLSKQKCHPFCGKPV